MAKVFCPNCASIANPLHRASTVGTATGITAGGAVVSAWFAVPVPEARWELSARPSELSREVS